MTVRNSVRIIGGAWRGRRIGFPDIEGLRPTPDRVRETLFNWLQRDIAGTRCLDLFAGSGALGLEALSRGAADTVFVEKDASAARSIRDHLRRFGGQGTVIETEVLRYLEQARLEQARLEQAGRLPRPEPPFNLVFLDPPFAKDWLPTLLPALDAGSLIAPGGLVYIECERTLKEPPLPPGWDMLRSKSAGEVGYHLARAHSQVVQ